MMNRKVRTKLDYQPSTSEVPMPNNEVINQRDMEYKRKLKSNAENRNTRHHNISIGDYVLLKQTKKNKWSTTFEPAFYVVYRVDGSSIAARRVTDGREVYRDASMYKLVNSVVQNLHLEEPLAKQLNPKDWREELFSKIPTEENLPPPPVAQSEQPVEPEPEPRPAIQEPQLNVSVRPRRTRKRPAYLKDYVDK